MIKKSIAVLRSPVETLGFFVTEKLNEAGSITIYLGKLLYWTFKPPFRLKLFVDQLYFVGNKSIGIVTLTSSFSGMVMAYQTYIGFSVINADSLVGPVVAISLAKELGPVFSGLIVTGRCGAAMAAQLGTMKVTEQVDALEVMGINSIQYLAVPRVWGATIAMPLLAAIFLVVGNLGSYIIGVYVLNIDEVLYFSKLKSYMDMAEIYEGLIKATVFGFLIGLIGTYHGLNVKGGAEGVGKGTNMAVVMGMIFVLVIDFFLTTVLVPLLDDTFY